jgi:hypothetical protein
MPTKTRSIGPIGTSTRIFAGLALLYLALFQGTQWRLGWYEAALGLALLPTLTLVLALTANRRQLPPIRPTGPTATTINCLVIIALVATPYTAAGAELFYGATLLIAAWRGQPGCEATALSNWILARDDQIGCPTFSPIDHAETRLQARHPDGPREITPRST